MTLQAMNQLDWVKWLPLNSLLVLLMLHQLASVAIFVQAQNSSSSFDFPNFTSTNNLLLNGDALYVPNVSSIWLQPFYNGSSTGSNYSCGGLIYADITQMRNSSNTSVTVASFNTSFTFSIAGETSAGMAFTFLAYNHTTGFAGGSLCLLEKPQNGNSSNHVFAVEFDTWLNPEFDDPSNNHVGVNINSMNSTWVYNLCGNSTACSFLDTDQDFTCWIDYDSATQTLEVFFTNGSTIQGISKPANAIIYVSSLDLTNVFNDNMFVAITGSGAMYPEVKEIKSWSFKTGSFGGGEIPAIQSRSKSKSAVAVIVGAVSAVCVLSVALLCTTYFVFWRPRDVPSL